MVVKDGAQTALDTIAGDGIADALADHETKAAVGKAIGQTAHDYAGPATTAARLAYAGKRAGIPQAVAPFHGIMAPRNEKLVLGLAVSQLDGEVFASAQAPPFEHVASSGCLHALAKAMGFQPFAYFGLPSSLGHAVPVNAMRHEPAAQAGPMKDSRGL